MSAVAALPKINVAVLGLGGVGAATLAILQSASLAAKFRVIALANSSSSLVVGAGVPQVPEGTNPSQWLNAQAGREPLDLPALLTKLSFVGGAETILVDNTSSETVAALYPTMLRLGLHVVTPNKKAWSGELDLWEDIQTAASQSKRGVLYLGESTVGAGLPILTTLKDLVETGDEVVKIEGVLSGTREWRWLGLCSFSPLSAGD